MNSSAASSSVSSPSVTSSVLYPVAAIRAIEAAALKSLPSGTLMRKAGQAAADAAAGLLRPRDAAKASMRPKVLVMAGPGNNGGDALIAAAFLARSGMDVTVLFETARSALSQEAQAALEEAESSPAVILGFSSLDALSGRRWDLAVDGLFGIGLNRPVCSPYREAIQALNRLPCPVLALDVPSGLNADTGNLIGEVRCADSTSGDDSANDSRIAVVASHTVTFIGDKPGLHTGYGRDHAGEVLVADLDIDVRLFGCFDEARLFRNEVTLFAHCLKKRPHRSHKGSFGDAAVVGGAAGMQGAAILAGRSALKSGAGRVLVGFVDSPPAYDALQPELMCRHADQLDFARSVPIVGPGLGQSPRARELLAAAFAAPMPMVLDADALNLMAADGTLQRAASKRRASTIITPHPLEAARLLATGSAAVQADRVAAARELSRRFNAVAVLKGSGTVIAALDGRAAINLTGNPALASGGTGDVLAGVCGALLAQGWPAWEAALAAVWSHGKAADLLVEQGTGPVGLAASELLPVIRDILNRLNSKAAE